MEDRIMRKYTLWMVIACLLICSSLVYLPKFTAYAGGIIKEYRQIREEARKRESMSSLELLKYHQEQIQPEVQKAIGNAIRIVIPDGVTYDEIKVENDFMHHEVRLFLPKTDESILNKFPIVGDPSHIEEMKVWEESGGLYIEFHTDIVVEPILEERDKDEYCYISLKDPNDIFDKIIVVDAGHGGKMPGTIRGNVREKDINLRIVEQLKAIMDKQNDIKVYYTRLNDENVELWDRVDLANELDADFFISIHQNSLGVVDSRTSGAQVLYSESAKGKYNSKKFSRIILESVVKETGCINRGLVKGDYVYIIREAKMPVALAEIGFISNRQERENLLNKKYQKKVAKAIYRGILKAYQSGL